MASRFKRTSVRKRAAEAKALGLRRYRQRVVPNKKREAKYKWMGSSPVCGDPVDLRARSKHP